MAYLLKQIRQVDASRIAVRKGKQVPEASRAAVRKGKQVPEVSKADEVNRAALEHRRGFLWR